MLALRVIMLDSDAVGIVDALVESGDRPLRAVLRKVDGGTSAKVKQLMEQLDGQIRVICVPGRSSKSVASEILHVTRVCASSMRKVLEKQKEEKLVRAPRAPLVLLWPTFFSRTRVVCRVFLRTRRWRAGRPRLPVLWTSHSSRCARR